MPRLLRILTIIFLFLNFALPKAGTKIGNFPLYLSALLTILVFLPLTFYRTVKNYREREERSTLIYFISFLLVFALDIILQGVPSPASAIFDSYLPYFIALSSVFLIFTAKYTGIKAEDFKFIILCSFFILTIYGLVQKIFGDMNTIIPGITFNYSEAINISPKQSLNVWAKHNFVEGLNYLKLSSTYQNGNLFGVNYILISWFAFYFLKESKGWLLKTVYYASILLYIIICFLTASATVYIGLIVSLSLLFILTVIDIIKSGDRNKKIKITALIAVPALLLITAILIINNVRVFHSLLFNRFLGRNFLGNERVTDFLSYIKYLIENKGLLQFLFGSFFKNPNNTGGYEITLVYVFVNSGIIFTFLFISYIFIFMKKLKFSLYNIGIFSYLAASFIDGGFWLPPTAFSFFTLIGISLYILRKQSVPIQKIETA